MTPHPSHPALAARRTRFRRIRQSVLATAVAMFVAVFSTIYVQMATGQDPAVSSGSSPSGRRLKPS